MRIGLWTGLLAALLWLVAPAATIGEPQLTSAFPVGGQQGAEFKTIIRGRALDHASAVWFDCEHLSATIVAVENDKSGPAGESKKKGSSTEPLQLLSLNVKVAPEAGLGLHYMRVLTPGGISNALPVRIHSESAILEDSGKHELPESAQHIAVLPIVINGTLPGGGALDYYSFEVDQGETLRFDALTTGGLDPALTLFEPTGSWFRPDRLTELAFNDEETSYPGLPLNATLTYKFSKKGHYLVRVNGFLGEGGSDSSYQLCVRRAAADQSEAKLMRAAHLPPPSADVSWKERSWSRVLAPNRLKTLWSRAVDSGATIPEIPVVRLNDPTHDPVPVSIPVLIEGTIDRPAKIDRVRFEVKGGERVVVEVETVNKTIPLFNPYVRIVSASGDEAFTNVHSTVNTCGDTILKQVQAKTIYSFPRDGEFILEIRDITHAYGDSTFAYRVLLRQQIPHMGEIHMAEEQINLKPGEVTKASIDTDQEEGYDGQIALTVEGLPEGVRAVMGTELQPQVPPPYNPGKIERFKPESQKATFLFMTDRSAPATSKPIEAKIMAQPVVKAKLGRPILVKRVLFTVVHPEGI